MQNCKLFSNLNLSLQFPLNLTMTWVIMLLFGVSSVHAKTRQKIPGKLTPLVSKHKAVAPSPKLEGKLDLHAHLFMAEGVGFDYMGAFHQPIQATRWDQKLPSRVNDLTINQSENRLVVISLYTHPLFRGTQRDAIRRQLAALREFLARDHNWILVKSPGEARAVLRNPLKKALLLSLEGAAGVLETEKDLVEFVDQAGLTIVTPHHFTDDAFGGANYAHRALGFLLNPLSFVQGANKTQSSFYFRANSVGLTEKGTWLISELLKRQVWLDYSHSSDLSQKAMWEMQLKAGASAQPVLFSHSILRRFYQGERSIGDWQIEAVKKSQGLIGVIPSESMLYGSPPHPSGCEGGFHWFQAQMRELIQQVGIESVGMGTDVNAPLTFLRADCPKDVLPAGLVHYGQLPDLRAALKESGLGEISLEDFISRWSRVRPR